MLRNFRKSFLAQLVLLAFVACTMTLHATTLTCTSTLENPGVVLVSQLTSGACVQSGDKLYGDFNLENLPTGSGLLFAARPNSNSITFFGSFALNTTYDFGYQVAVTNSLNFISGLSADVGQTVGTSSILITTTPTGTGTINFTRTGIVVSGTSSTTFSSTQHVTDLMVNERFTKGAASDATSVLNTVLQSPVPEPSSLMLFGSGLLGLASIGRRRLVKK